MQIFTARTCETFDMEYLCEDLGKQIAENVQFGSRTMGIAICDSTIDYPAVMKKLSEMYDFDIYGATALAFIGIHSVEDISVSFMIITGDEELVGSMALSEPWTPENVDKVVRDAYNLGRERLGEDPKMLITLQPFSTEITSDITTRILDDASGHCPIYGAVSSADLSSNISGIFVNGEFYTDRILINMLGGGIQPRFAVAQVKLPTAHKRVVITKASGNVVYNVGEDTFLRFMEKNGLVVEPSYVLESFIATYTSSPVIIYCKENGEEVEKIRNIIHIDYETGAVGFTGEMPEGCELTIAVLRREDVVASSKACFEDMIAKIEQNTSDQYRYSTLFASSCGGRYLIMTGDTSMEGDYITNNPALRDLASCGFYAMGEICPLSVDENGKADNRAYHSSIVLMAL